MHHRPHPRRPAPSPLPLAPLALALLAACGDGASPTPAAEAACREGATVAGTASWYGPGAVNGCAFPSTPAVGVALPPGRFGGSAACGGCLWVDGPKGTVVARVIEACPACAQDEVALTAGAFEAVAEPAEGDAGVTFREAACPVAGPVRYELVAAGPTFLAVVVSNTRFAPASLEVRPAGAAASTPMARSPGNAFEASFGGALAGPLTLRLTDAQGHVLTDTVALASGVQDGAAQLPATCR